MRDMFQNGDIRPIEELDDFEAYVSPPPFASVDDPSRFLRTLPGSPPLSALRNHRSIIAKEVGDKPQSEWWEALIEVGSKNDLAVPLHRLNV
ncbi:unnamed protein product [Echinostoma caproni]|uniref:Uncharacterized protein n=1 Tax=Echinostoma caproni TaxID=27848 RepID=A0A3P8L0U5_9TREM|nr:unnamed protein product [Echinostoma caproni]